MNTTMVRLLVLKDWRLFRVPLLGYLAAGGLSIALMDLRSEFWFYLGCVLLFTCLISMGIHLVMGTVVQERTQHTLPFVMSLPISVVEYTAAKLVANLMLFALAWTLMLLGMLLLIALSPQIPDGLVAFAVLIMLEMLVGYCLLLAVALISESQSWTIAAMVATNLGFQAFLFLLGGNKAMQAENKGELVLWSGPAIPLLVVAVVMIVGLIWLTFVLQARKRDFV